MDNTQKIYACGFPNQEPYSSIIKEEQLILLTKEELLKKENINEKDVFFIYSKEFETFIIEYLRILSKIYTKNPLVIIGENYSQSYLENLFEEHPFTFIKLPSTKETIKKELIKAKEGKCSYIPQPNNKEWLSKAKEIRPDTYQDKTLGKSRRGQSISQRRRQPSSFCINTEHFKRLEWEKRCIAGN